MKINKDDIQGLIFASGVPVGMLSAIKLANNDIILGIPLLIIAMFVEFFGVKNWYRVQHDFEKIMRGREEAKKKRLETLAKKKEDGNVQPTA